MQESQEKQIRASCRALATYKLQTSFSALVQPDNHVVQKFDTRKIYQLSNEVIFSPPFLSVSPHLLLTWRDGKVMLTQLVYILDRK